MQTGQKKWLSWQIAGGVVTLTSGLTLIGMLNLAGSVSLSVNFALGLAGITLCIAGMRLLLLALSDDTPPVPVDGHELGCLQLNGRFLVAYESTAPDGKKQFRLAAAAALTAHEEAALIRYMALEGFLISLWPEMKDRIEEEAGWAFLV